MSREFKDYTSQFFWSFKRMDNVNYNFSIVEMLYKAKKHYNDDEYFNKPIIVLLLAIIECCLYDFFMRITGHTQDPLPNLKKSIISFFKLTKETDELKKLIDRIRSHNLFGIDSSNTLYKDLDHLRKIRNRVHIQNRNHELDIDKDTDRYRDEIFIFTDDTLLLAENSFEKVIEILCNNHPRWHKKPLPMKEFPRPWP